MNMYQGAGSGNWVKWVVGFVVLLLVGACVAGMILAESYWGNPPREQALADRTQIENEGLKTQQDAEAERQRIENKIIAESWEIDAEALKQKNEDESKARQESAELALLWQDRWNKFGMGLATAIAAGLLIIGGVLLVTSGVARARERLQQRAIELEVKQAERLREERRLEQVRLERVRVALTPEQVGGNGKGHKAPLKQSMMSSLVAQVSSQHPPVTDQVDSWSGCPRTTECGAGD
jgi:hypothetical protein